MEYGGNNTYIIGIDEAGRGPLAGPVVVAGVCIEARRKKQWARVLQGIKDSKKLSEKKREQWFQTITTNSRISYAVTFVSPAVIDKINIAQAANRGVFRVYKKLSASCHRESREAFLHSSDRVKQSHISHTYNTHIRATTFQNLRLGVSFGKNVGICAVLDGGLWLPNHIPHEVIIKGDERHPLIAAASIIAKVTRDRIMKRLHKKYPHYGFNQHKGYGTKLHRENIRYYGRCIMHRASFLKKYPYHGIPMQESS